jgi:hypothetical protein
MKPQGRLGLLFLGISFASGRIHKRAHSFIYLYYLPSVLYYQDPPSDQQNYFPSFHLRGIFVHHAYIKLCYV